MAINNKLGTIAKEIDPRATPTPTKQTLCSTCAGYGYLEHEQYRAPEGGDYICRAFANATPCMCAAGKWFAEMQVKFNAT